MITAIPFRLRGSAQPHYLKLRDRATFEFALVSAAIALEMATVSCPHVSQWVGSAQGHGGYLGCRGSARRSTSDARNAIMARRLAGR